MDKTVSVAQSSRALLQELIERWGVKYKHLIGFLAASAGTYGLIVLLSKCIPDDEEIEEYENYFVRRIVSRWWIPMLHSKISFWTARKPLSILDKEATEALAKARERWLYPDNNALGEIDPNNLEMSSEELLMLDPDDEFSMDLVYLYRTTRMLGEVQKDHVLRLWKGVEELSLNQGDYLFRIGEKDDHAYIILEGQVELYCKDDSLKKIGVQAEDADHMQFKDAYTGQTIYSVLSLIDILTDHLQPLLTVEAVATVSTRIYKVPLRTFKYYWDTHPQLLTRVIRRLIRRIYQVIFVALHKVLGLSTELIAEVTRTKLDPAFLADHSTNVSEQDRQTALKEAMDYMQLTGEENFALLSQSRVVTMPKGFFAVRSGSRNSAFVYVYKGELEVSQRVTYDTSRVNKATDQVLFYVGRGQAVGGLSYLTDDVNIFNIKVPQKAIVVVTPDEILSQLLESNPTLVRIVAHSIIGRLSPFARDMDYGLEWTFIESGNTVYKAGDPPSYTYLVLSGRLRSILTDPKGRTSMKGEYGKNDLIGLVETLTKKYRSKTVIAVRDTELAKIPDGLLTVIKLKFPIVSMRLLDFLGKRVARNYGNGAKGRAQLGITTIALIPVRNTIPTRVFAYSLKANYDEFGIVRSPDIKVITKEEIIQTLGVHSLSPDNDYHLTANLGTLEDRFGLLIFVAEPEQPEDFDSTDVPPELKEESAREREQSTLEVIRSEPLPPEVVAENRTWTKKCIKQADIILILMDGSEKRDTEITPIEKLVNHYAPRARKELILVHGSKDEARYDGVYPTLTRLWLNKRKWISFHHHIGMRPVAYDFLNSTYEEVERDYPMSEEISKHSDFARLTRWICKKSIGVVLGGGGAKGAAHLGVLKILKKTLDLPIDYIAGVSIGSFIGGLYAMTQDIDWVETTTRDWFDKIARSYQYIFDLTFPHISLFKGEAFNHSIKSCFADTQIEDLRIPYFTVTTDMTANRSRVHRSGPLWRYTRASMTLSFLFPPICDIDGHFLMDGGYTNLVPANLMRSFGVGYILGVDVSANEPVETTNYGDHLSGFQAILPHLLPYLEPYNIPTYFALQQQLSFVQSALYMEIIKEMDRSSIYIRPPMDFYTTSDFEHFEKIMAGGFAYGQQIFRHCKASDEIDIMWNKIAQDLFSFKNDILNAPMYPGGPSANATATSSKVSMRKSLFMMGIKKASLGRLIETKQSTFI